MSNTTFSFEFFPPKTEKAAESLWAAVPKLIKLNPKFMTVTYGAGGTTKGGTLETIKKKMEMTDIPVGSHLTFINTTKSDLKEYADELWNKGIKHIVALRGDMPEGLQWPLDTDGEYFQYTSDFVEGLLSWHPFEISVGAYPEKHPDAPNINDDIRALKLKCDAGANRAITQFFFDNDVYFRFVEKCDKAGITTPIVPGLLPIHDFKAMCGFAKRCNTNVPDFIYEQFDCIDNDLEEAKKVATELLINQTNDLHKKGVSHIHYYTLNKSDIICEVIEKTLI